ncbi:MAG: hypothetical protein WDN45_16250 [Caulobacteraceae bacterium]
MIAAGLPARLYYTAYANNAFDTHVVQNDQHPRLLTYTSDAVLRLHAGHGAPWPRRRRHAHDLLGVRPARAGKHQPGHRPWRGQCHVRRRQEGEGRPLWRVAQPDQTGRG